MVEARYEERIRQGHAMACPYKGSIHNPLVNGFDPDHFWMKPLSGRFG
jgi:hypothetical protein